LVLILPLDIYEPSADLFLKFQFRPLAFTLLCDSLIARAAAERVSFL